MIGQQIKACAEATTNGTLPERLKNAVLLLGLANKLLKTDTENILNTSFYDIVVEFDLTLKGIDVTMFSVEDTTIIESSKQIVARYKSNLEAHK